MIFKKYFNDLRAARLVVLGGVWKRCWANLDSLFIVCHQKVSTVPRIGAQSIVSPINASAFSRAANSRWRRCRSRSTGPFIAAGAPLVEDESVKPVQLCGVEESVAVAPTLSASEPHRSFRLGLRIDCRAPAQFILVWNGSFFDSFLFFLALLCFYRDLSSIEFELIRRLRFCSIKLQTPTNEFYNWARIWNCWCAGIDYSASECPVSCYGLVIDSWAEGAACKSIIIRPPALSYRREEQQ